MVDMVDMVETLAQAHGDNAMQPVWMGAAVVGAALMCWVVALGTVERSGARGAGKGASGGPVMSRKALREVEKKQKLKDTFEKKGSVAASGSRHEPGAVPPGNFPTPKWLCTDLGAPVGSRFKLDEAEWSLEIRLGGAHDGKSKSIKLRDVESLPSFGTYEGVQWNCVTGWTMNGLSFQGVPLKDALALAGLSAAEDASWSCLYQVCADGYTVPVLREDAESSSALFVTRDGSGELISHTHGGPRLALPALWGWKSGKWLTRIELLPAYQPGFWERLTCHARGRVFDETTGLYVEERWAQGLGLFSDALTGLANIWHRLLGPRAYGTVMYYGGKIVGKGGSVLGLMHAKLDDFGEAGATKKPL